MTTVQQIKNWPINQKGSGFEVTVKTAGKTWQLPKSEKWMQQTVIQDETGEMRADFFIRKYTPIRSGQQYYIHIGIVQEDMKYGKKLYIDQFHAITQTADEYEASINFALEESERIVRSKIKHGLVCAWVRRTADNVDKDFINDLVEYIVK